MIDRQNILELIGGDSRKYHSCILTCYSFDFIFFEQRILPYLRGAGIVNINVFVDGSIYEQQLQNALGHEYRAKKSYSITPVYLRGAFHPKILLAAGKNNGFVAIGSGNLTNSGLSSNDEVWGAFHTNKGEGEAAGLFKQSYQYLSQLANHAYGTNKTKLDWIIDNATWLKALLKDKSSLSFASHNEYEEVSILSTFADQSIYKNLLDRLPPETNPDKITIISPYFNNNGAVIDQMTSDLKPDKIDVVLDPTFGTIPYKFNTRDHVHFHTWKDVIEDSSHISRLHAKIIQFEYKQVTYLLFGSPNATREALGSTTSKPINAEMALLIKAEQPKDWLSLLSINIPDQSTYDLKSYKPGSNEGYEVMLKTFPIKILHAELDAETLTIFTDRTIDSPLSLCITDRLLDTHLLPITFSNENQIILTIDPDLAEHIFKIHFEDEKGSVLSNQCLVHFKNLLRNTNPDATKARFYELISNDEFSHSDLEELLEYAQFEKRDYTSLKVSGKRADSESKNPDYEKEYDTLSEDEFNKNAEIIQASNRGHSSIISLLEEFLSAMVFNDPSRTKEDLSDSLERTAEEHQDMGISGADISVGEEFKLSFTEGKRLKDKLHGILNKANKFIHSLKEESRNPDNEKNFTPVISIDEIKAILVGLHLILMKMEDSFEEERSLLKVRFKKKEDLRELESKRELNIIRCESQKGAAMNEVYYTIDSNAIESLETILNSLTTEGIEMLYLDESPSQIIKHHYYDVGEALVKAAPKTIKGFVLHTFCPLLHLMAHKEEPYSGQELSKYVFYKKRLFNRISFLILNLNWRQKEKKLRNLILLNAIHLLLPDTTFIESIEKELNSYRDKTSINHHSYEENYQALSKMFYVYKKWKEIYSVDKLKLIQTITTDKIGSIIFKNQLGFVELKSLNEMGFNGISPLGELNTNDEEFQLRKIKSGKTAIFLN